MTDNQKQSVQLDRHHAPRKKRKLEDAGDDTCDEITSLQAGASRRNKLNLPLSLMQGLLRVQTKFIDGSLVTEQDLEGLTVTSQFDQMIVVEIPSCCNQQDQLNEEEMKMWKDLKKKIVRNRKAARTSRYKKEDRTSKIEKELDAVNFCTIDVLGLTYILASRESYNNNVDAVLQDINDIILKNKGHL